MRFAGGTAHRQERRIFLEAMIVSVLGHAIFFSVFTVREIEAAREGVPLPAVISIAQFDRDSARDSRVTAHRAATPPDLPEQIEIERRTASPKLELDRTTPVWEDEPELAEPAEPREGPGGDEPTLRRVVRPLNDYANHLGDIRTIRFIRGNGPDS